MSSGSLPMSACFIVAMACLTAKPDAPAAAELHSPVPTSPSSVYTRTKVHTQPPLCGSSLPMMEA